MADIDKGQAVLDRSAASRPKLVSAVSKQAVLEDLWDKGLPPGFATGWPSVDELYTVVPGQLTVATGWPNSGKSEWVDALAVNLARQGWRIAYFSPENMPVELHIAKLMEKFDGRPFGAGPTQRIDRSSIPTLAERMDQFRFLEPVEGSLSAKDVCDTTEPWLRSSQKPRGLVIDPWNELEHWRPHHMSETEYVSQTLSEVRQWARKNNVHVWIIAHPQKMRREDGQLPVPKPDMISGSQHWWNKADCCVTVYRDMNKQTADVEIYVQKVRFKHVGRIGVTTLKYDRITGRYAEPSRFASYSDAKEAR
jgi:twinkle protein